MVDAFLRAKSLERSAVSHHPELAVAVGAMVLHGFLPAERLIRADAGEGQDHEVSFRFP
jgi:hypothetical protein